ncbi:hypothetical protein F5883DRAFT_477078, partial [Diaporthe sp. PMI_573]
TSEADDGETVVIKKARIYACPFYIQNSQYTECVRRHHLTSIEDVKVHVCRDHRQPWFCPVCREEFVLAETRDAHIRRRTCHANASSTPDGITFDQEDQIEEEGESYTSEDSRWFKIWDIIFPRIARPSSGSYTAQRDVAVCDFRKSWRENGKQLVAEFLDTEACQGYSIRNKGSALRTIYDLVRDKVVDRIFHELGSSL